MEVDRPDPIVDLFQSDRFPDEQLTDNKQHGGEGAGQPLQARTRKPSPAVGEGWTSGACPGWGRRPGHGRQGFGRYRLRPGLRAASSTARRSRSHTWVP